MTNAGCAGPPAARSQQRPPAPLQRAVARRDCVPVCRGRPLLGLCSLVLCHGNGPGMQPVHLCSAPQLTVSREHSPRHDTASVSLAFDQRVAGLHDNAPCVPLVFVQRAAARYGRAIRARATAQLACFSRTLAAPQPDAVVHHAELTGGRLILGSHSYMLCHGNGPLRGHHSQHNQKTIHCANRSTHPPSQATHTRPVHACGQFPILSTATQSLQHCGGGVLDHVPVHACHVPCSCGRASQFGNK